MHKLNFFFVMKIEDAFFNTSDYTLTAEKLGQGSFGTVFVAENIYDKKKYAAKIINVDENFDGHEQMLFLRESLILHKLDHPSIVKFKGVNFKSFKGTELQPAIITEILSNGSLGKILETEKRSLAPRDWNDTKKYITLIGIANAMQYLHSQGIIHRDLKPENILTDENYYPKVCDFGLSKCFPESFSSSMKLTISGQFGTPLYMAPELFRDENIYDSSIDVYAFSMIAYEIVSGEKPFKGANIFTLAEKVKNGIRPERVDGITQKMWDLLCKCWSMNPEERPTFEYIFNELSKDITYFNETIDEGELIDYLDILSEHKSEEISAMKKLQNEVADDHSQIDDQPPSVIFKTNQFADVLLNLMDDNNVSSIDSISWKILQILPTSQTILNEMLDEKDRFSSFFEICQMTKNYLKSCI